MIYPHAIFVLLIVTLLFAFHEVHGAKCTLPETSKLQSVAQQTKAIECASNLGIAGGKKIESDKLKSGCATPACGTLLKAAGSLISELPKCENTLGIDVHAMFAQIKSECSKVVGGDKAGSGKDGNKGTDGNASGNGADGADGKGTDGADGNGTDGKADNGKDGNKGADGNASGKGADGNNGGSGTDGKDGANGSSIGSAATGSNTDTDTNSSGTKDGSKSSASSNSLSALLSVFIIAAAVHNA